MLQKIWIEVRSSLWFVPLILVVAAVGLALVLVQVDVTFTEVLQKQRWEPLLNAGSGGARGMLTAIASSMITVAGVAFSVTIVTLSLASTQYTPRILRNFMRDRANQFVLGFFVSVYTYCLVVLRTIRSGGEEGGGGFVPLLAVAVGMLLALLSIGCLIFFIHHIATSIQASTILKAISDETSATIDVLFPDELGDGEDEIADENAWRAREWRPIAGTATGYLQHIDAGGVLNFATKHDCVLRLECGPGDFVAEGSPIAFADRELEEGVEKGLHGLFVVGEFRTLEQDAGFGIRQIVDIACKALSPGINDTSTAVSCLDYLSAILAKLAQRRAPSPYRAEEGRLRVLAPVPRFEDHLAKAMNEIRHSAGGNVTILIQMLLALRRIALSTRSSGRRAALREHASLVAELAEHTVPARYDRERINREILELREVLDVGIAELPLCSPDCEAAVWG